MIIQTDKKLGSESNENQIKSHNINMIKPSLILSNKIGGSLIKRATIRIREEAIGPNDELNYCIKIMEKTNRNVNEIHTVANYLKGLDELIKFFKTVSENFEELIVTISCMLRNEYHQRNKIIFKTGDKSGKFYIHSSAEVLFGFSQDLLNNILKEAQAVLKNHSRVVLLIAEVLQKKYINAFSCKMQNNSDSR